MTTTSTITIETLKPHYAEALAELQRIALPTLGEAEWLRKEHFLKHCELFPEGNFVAVCDGQVVGLGSGFLCFFDFDQPKHTFMEFIADGYYTNHDSQGDWYYGADISVHPEYRRRGIGALLYKARKAIVKQLNKRGIVAGGLLPGFAKHKAHMTAHHYVKKVVAEELYDPTLSFQLRHGFKVRGLLENYIHDAPSDNWSTLIVWENNEYRA